jgi:hypothetical protein
MPPLRGRAPRAVPRLSPVSAEHVAVAVAVNVAVKVNVDVDVDVTRRGERSAGGGYLQQVVVVPEQHAAALYSAHSSSSDTPAMAVASAGMNGFASLPFISMLSL